MGIGVGAAILSGVEIGEDRLERQNMADLQPEQAAELRGLLSSELGSVREDEIEAADLDVAVVDRLKALGYL